jgi:hypothetical protein
METIFIVINPWFDETTVRNLLSLMVDIDQLCHLLGSFLFWAR